MDGLTYNCSEQFIQSKKAEIFNDDQAKSWIMNSKSAKEIKQIGSRINDYIQQSWERDYAKTVCTTVITEKFSQHPAICELLLSTNNKTIIEASRDRFWGC